ncbi:MAG: OadG family protein [Bacillota bacterium]|nr:OadG family protein [Bacillota bacterium]
MDELINISIGNASLVAILGYCVVFLGLVLLMCVVMLMGKVMTSKSGKAAKAAPAAVEAIPEAPKAEPAPGSAGDLKLYDTDPKDAAMIMAIVADSLGKPLNELRFISIKEVKDE